VDVKVPPPAFRLLPSTEQLEQPIGVDGNLVLSPETAWTAVGIDPRQKPQHWDLQAPVTRSVGSGKTLVAMALSVLVMGGIGGWSARQFLLRRPLGGTFWWRRGMEGRQALDIAHLQQANLVALPDGTLGHGSPEAAMLVLWRTSNTRAFVDVKHDNVEINSRKAARGRHEIVPGATSFQMGEYRLTWE
jgi:hypothetical protein